MGFAGDGKQAGLLTPQVTRGGIGGVDARIDSTDTAPRYLRGQEASLFPIPGEAQDDSSIAGYFVVYHSADSMDENGKADGRIYCSVTQSLNPAGLRDWVTEQ